MTHKCVVRTGDYGGIVHLGYNICLGSLFRHVATTYILYICAVAPDSGGGIRRPDAERISQAIKSNNNTIKKKKRRDEILIFLFFSRVI